MAFRLGWSSLPDERFDFGGGLANLPFEAEGFLIRVDFMVIKKKEFFLFLQKEKRI
jgi:hypothetical protein